MPVTRLARGTATDGTATSAVAHLRIAGRTARDKAERSEVPHSSRTAHEPAAGRADPIEPLERQAATRVPELVPIRYGRMLVSPFGFCRGEARIMADDLAPTSGSWLHVQRCRDADGRQLKDGDRADCT